MINIFGKKENAEHDNGAEDPLLVLRGLEKDELSLMEEKRELLALKEKLQLKAKEKIEIMQLRIQTLTNEISDLKHQCEELESSVSLG